MGLKPLPERAFSGADYRTDWLGTRRAMLRLSAYC
jgi:hypothetical protein